MSVTHPLAAENAQAHIARDPGTGDRRDGNAARGGHPEARSPGPGPTATAREQAVAAPERLGLDSRIEFREAASTLTDRIADGTGALVIECGRLRSIDSSGLNALILVQRKAAQKRIRVVLRDLNEELLALLVLTKLDALFEIQNARAR